MKNEFYYSQNISMLILSMVWFLFAGVRSITLFHDFNRESNILLFVLTLVPGIIYLARFLWQQKRVYIKIGYNSIECYPAPFIQAKLIHISDIQEIEVINNRIQLFTSYKQKYYIYLTNIREQEEFLNFILDLKKKKQGRIDE